jgi:hypothetical protein
MSTDGNTGEGQGGSGEGQGSEGTPKTLADLIKSDPKHQEELNKMMADNRRKLTQQNQELVTQLEELKRSSSLTNEQRDELQTRITQLEEQYMTKEELAKRESTKQQKKWEQDLQAATQAGEQWKTLYSSSTIDRALQDAAIEGEALHPSQIVDLLRNRTQLTEVLDNGQPTGRYATVVKFNDVNDDGENVLLELSPADAIKRMKELTDKYGNLFKGTGTSGIGGARGADGSAPPAKLDDLLKDPVKYAEWRRKNPDLDLTKLK